jgi:protein SCO1/2
MIYNKILLLTVLFLSIFSNANSSELSLYNSTFKWKNEMNKDFILSDLKGKKVILAMGYTSCHGSCPMMVNKLKKIESLFQQKNINVEVVLISFDPIFDTPEKNYSFYRESMKIKNENWHFLSGTVEEARKMSMLLDIKYAKNPESGVIVHDNKVILLNENGEIIKRLESLGDDEALLMK